MKMYFIFLLCLLMFLPTNQDVGVEQTIEIGKLNGIGCRTGVANCEVTPPTCEFGYFLFQ